MKEMRPVERARLLLLLAIMLALALGSFWVLEVVRKGLSDSMPNISHNEPDYYVNKFKYVRMTPSGQVHYAVSGARLTHNPQTSSFEIVQPSITSLSDNQPPLTARADRAVAEQDNNNIHLYDNVIVDRPASKTTEHFQFKSDYMLVLPDDDVVQTNKPVEIALGASVLTGTGMYVNNATREFKLMHKVRGVFYPPADH
jgi:lipopolysaccharide export system protein LptC